MIPIPPCSIYSKIGLQKFFQKLVEMIQLKLTGQDNEHENFELHILLFLMVS
jgi:hypothetical protein